MSKCGTHMLVIIRMLKRSGSFPIIAPPLQLPALDVRLVCLCHAFFHVVTERQTSLVSNLSPSRKEGGKRITQTD
jgi:hypothetical protein